MTEDEILAGITTILCGQGVPHEKANVMAAQLWKRSGQLAGERGISREDALAYLLKITLSGMEGRVDPSWPGP